MASCNHKIKGQIAEEMPLLVLTKLFLWQKVVSAQWPCHAQGWLAQTAAQAEKIT